MRYPRRSGLYRSPDLSNNVKAACLQNFQNHHLYLHLSSRSLMCLYQWDHEQQVRRWAVPAGHLIFALIMLIILQVSAFPGLLQTSGIYDLSDFYLLWERVRWDVQQSCVISGFVILVLHSDPIPANQTIENVYVQCVYILHPRKCSVWKQTFQTVFWSRFFLWLTN